MMSTLGPKQDRDLSALAVSAANMAGDPRISDMEDSRPRKKGVLVKL